MTIISDQSHHIKLGQCKPEEGKEPQEMAHE